MRTTLKRATSANATLSFTLTFALFQSACTTVALPPVRPIAMENGSAVNLRTAYVAAELIWYAMQQNGCRRTDFIAPTTLRKSVDFQSVDGQIVQGQLKERWVAHGCGSTVSYLVDFEANRERANAPRIEVRRESSVPRPFSPAPTQRI